MATPTAGCKRLQVIKLVPDPTMFNACYATWKHGSGGETATEHLARFLPTLSEPPAFLSLMPHVGFLSRHVGFR
jgi:hypothetical protein